MDINHYSLFLPRRFTIAYRLSIIRWNFSQSHNRPRIILIEVFGEVYLTTNNQTYEEEDFFHDATLSWNLFQL